MMSRVLLYLSWLLVEAAYQTGTFLNKLAAVTPNVVSKRIDQVAKGVALSSLGIYKQLIDPYKSTKCPHKTLYNGESCSEYIKRTVSAEGLNALPKIEQRLEACGEAEVILASKLSSKATPSFDEDRTDPRCSMPKNLASKLSSEATPSFDDERTGPRCSMPKQRAQQQV